MTVTALDDRSPRGAVVMHLNITKRKLAEHMVTRMHRVYAALSGINGLIVRVSDREELFGGAYRVAIDAGGFRMATIATLDRDTMRLTPMASAGNNERVLDILKGVLSTPEDGPEMMCAQAIEQKTAVVCNDSENDGELVFNARYAQAGIYSMAVLPLVIAHEVVGVLTLYASEAGFFQGQEMKLLTELVGDIAYAMDHLDKQAQLDYLAYYDVLTGLANRRLFLERVAQHLRSAASGRHQVALFLVDLERFKNINDSLGAQTGDELLRQVAQWLTHHAAGDVSLLSRVGADHFAVVLPALRPERDLMQQVETWMAIFQKHPFQLNDAVFHISAKAGVAIFPDDGPDADTLFKHAEAALKKAKASGDRYLFSTAS